MNQIYANWNYMISVICLEYQDYGNLQFKIVRKGF